MMETVRFLSSDSLQGRETGSPGAALAADYIAAEFKQAGLVPGGDDGSFFQKGKDSGTGLSINNVIGIRPAKNPRSRESAVVGAHYDHLGRDPDGAIYNGANVNASGAAVMLEIARLWQAQGFRPARNPQWQPVGFVRRSDHHWELFDTVLCSGTTPRDASGIASAVGGYYQRARPLSEYSENLRPLIP